MKMTVNTRMTTEEVIDERGCRINGFFDFRDFYQDILHMLRAGSPLSGAAELHRIEEQANEGESLAAKVEALRVFLEDTLGVDRFYSAYR